MWEGKGGSQCLLIMHIWSGLNCCACRMLCACFLQECIPGATFMLVDPFNQALQANSSNTTAAAAMMAEVTVRG